MSTPERLHNAIMNIPVEAHQASNRDYKIGHRYARHAAAELASEFVSSMTPVPGDPRLLKTMAETIIAHVEKKAGEFGVEYTRDIDRPGGFGLQEPYELAVAYLASPGWHDRPTGPGLWVCVCINGILVEDVREQNMKWYAVHGWQLGRVFGPIPADSKEGV